MTTNVKSYVEDENKRLWRGLLLKGKSGGRRIVFLKEDLAAAQLTDGRWVMMTPKGSQPATEEEKLAIAKKLFEEAAA